MRSVLLLLFIYLCIYLFIYFLRLHLWHMEIPRLAVKLELQLPAYTTATATQEPSCICDLHHSAQQRWSLNPLYEARDRTPSSWILVGFVTRWAMTGTPVISIFNRWGNYSSKKLHNLPKVTNSVRQTLKCLLLSLHHAILLMGIDGPPSYKVNMLLKK